MANNSGGMFYPAPMPAPLPPTKNPPNGSRRKLPTVGAGVNLAYDTQTRTGLLTAKNLEWGSWAVTLDPVVTDPAAYGANPAAGNVAAGGPFDGYHPHGSPRAQVSWGVAGIIRSVEFDYPIAGGVFVLNANAVELSVRATQPDTGGFTLQEAVSLGAWLTPRAAAAAPTAMVLSNGDNTSQTPVPPYARNLIVSPYMAAAAVVPACEMQINFMNVNLSRLWQYRKLVGAGTSGDMFTRVPVPPWAVQVEIVFTNVAVRNTSLWELSFA